MWNFTHIVGENIASLQMADSDNVLIFNSKFMYKAIAVQPVLLLFFYSHFSELYNEIIDPFHELTNHKDINWVVLNGVVNL